MNNTRLERHGSQDSSPKLADSQLRTGLEETRLWLGESSAFPVDIDSIISKLGIAVRFVTSSGKSAPYLELGRKPVIVVPRSSNQRLHERFRERFSIAHEIGHFVIWHRYNMLPSTDSEYWKHERICQEFASRLLVPPSLLQRQIEQLVESGRPEVFFPAMISESAQVSWEVAAKAISAVLPTEHAYLRISYGRRSQTGTSDSTPGQFAQVRVDSSSVSHRLGSFAGEGAIIKDREVLMWLVGMPHGHLTHKDLTMVVGLLSLALVPCALIRFSRRSNDRWIAHFNPTHKGVSIAGQP